MPLEDHGERVDRARYLAGLDEWMSQAELVIALERVLHSNRLSPWIHAFILSVFDHHTNSGFPLSKLAWSVADCVLVADREEGGTPLPDDEVSCNSVAAHGIDSK